jgi:hypothetical protein
MMSNRSTRTYAILEVSKATYSEIREAFKKAGYDDAFHLDYSDAEIIVMTGVAVKEGPSGG